LLAIDAHGLSRSLEGNHLVSFVVVEYGRAYHSKLMAALAQGPAQVTDMELPVTSAAAILPSLPHACRLLVSTVAARKLKLVKRARSGGLTEEVKSGTTCLMVDSVGEVERVVSVVALRLMRPSDGKFLAEVGKVRGDGVAAECRLPAIRQQAGETRVEAAQRLVATALPPLAEAMEITCVDPEEVAPGIKKAFKVATTYVKTLTHAVLTRSLSSLGLNDVTEALSITSNPPVLMVSHLSAPAAVGAPQSSTGVQNWIERNASPRWITQIESGISSSRSILSSSRSGGASSRFDSNASNRSLEVFAMCRGSAEDVRLYAWVDDAEFDEFHKHSGSVKIERILSRRQNSVAAMIRATRTAAEVERTSSQGTSQFPSVSGGLRSEGPLWRSSSAASFGIAGYASDENIESAGDPTPVGEADATKWSL